jgi:ORF6N domain
MSKSKVQIVPVERAESKIIVLRGQRVMLDSDLAEIYGVTTKRLNEQVKRNRSRFPEDFMFQLNSDETKSILRSRSHIATSNPENLKSQIATSSCGGRRKLPFAFTEHGAVMLASVLNSPTAVKASILVVRAFIQLRKMSALNANLAIKVAELESKYSKHDRAIQTIIKTLKALIEPPLGPPDSPRNPIGFRAIKK